MFLRRFYAIAITIALAVLVLFSFLNIGFFGNAAAGQVDPFFTSSPGAQGGLGQISHISVDSIGRIYVNGDFNTYNNQGKRALARLTNTGTFDPAFDVKDFVPIFGSYQVDDTDIFDDDKVLVSGFFETYDGVTKRGLVKLNADGSADDLFDPADISNGARVFDSVIADSGSIYIIGTFTTVGGQQRTGLAKLNSDGSLNTTFVVPGFGFDPNVRDLVEQADQRVVVVGNMNSYNGTTVNRIVRLNTDGTIDNTFNIGTGPAGGNNNLAEIDILSDGDLMVTGDFTSFNGVSTNGIVRLNPDGSVDNSFSIAASTYANGASHTRERFDGKFLVYGFRTASPSYPVFQLLNSDGTLDTTYPSTNSIFPTSTAELDLNGNVLVGGRFTQYEGESRGGIVRLYSFDQDGVGTNTDLTANAGVQTIYAGDAIDNDDICSPANITGGDTVEGVLCSTAANSLALPSIASLSTRQNPQATLNDTLVEDLRGEATSNYTVTAEVSDFTTGSATITLGSNPDSASATLDSGTVTSVNIGDNGTGSCTDATVAFSGGGGSGAAADAVISSGVVSKINITNAGSGYTTIPTVTIAPTGCTTTPTGSANIIAANANQSSGTVNSITIGDDGTDSCTDATVAITGGNGSGATATATVSGGVVSEIVVTNPGSGYDSVPTVTITPTGCSTTPTGTANITALNDPEANIFATVDPSVGDIDRILPDSDITNFNVGPRSLVTNTTTQYTLFSTSSSVTPGRFDIDGTTFGLRVPAFVEAGTYTGTIVQTVIN